MEDILSELDSVGKKHGRSKASGGERRRLQNALPKQFVLYSSTERGLIDLWGLAVLVDVYKYDDSWNICLLDQRNAQALSDSSKCVIAEFVDVRCFVDCPIQGASSMLRSLSLRTAFKATRERNDLFSDFVFKMCPTADRDINALRLHPKVLQAIRSGELRVVIDVSYVNSLGVPPPTTTILHIPPANDNAAASDLTNVAHNVQFGKNRNLSRIRIHPRSSHNDMAPE